MGKTMVVTFSDGSRYSVSVDVIAVSRAEHYKSDFDGDLGRSLAEDTVPLFADDDYEIHDWASNNMNWSDLESHAIRLPASATSINKEREWGNCEKKIVPIARPNS